MSFVPTNFLAPCTPLCGTAAGLWIGTQHLEFLDLTHIAFTVKHFLQHFLHFSQHLNGFYVQHL